ncbi:hypothetical protein WA588_002733 [Blastocystis sp. NMH]
MRELRSRMEAIRKNYPNMRSFPVSFHTDNDVVMVSFGFSNYVNFFSLLQELIERIHKDGEVSIEQVTQEDGTASISLIYGDGKRSIEILFDGHEGRISFFADDAFASEDNDIISSIYEYCLKCQYDATSIESENSRTAEIIQRLESMGVQVFTPQSVPNGQTDENEDVWDQIAGYDQIKQDIKDTVILSIKYPEKYREIARKTRKNYTCPLPRSLLFEGPPGTGKTSIARIIAQESNVILVHIPLESIVNKYYGESEKRLNGILKLCNEIDNCIIFIDEAGLDLNVNEQIDAVVTNRDNDQMNEATRRLLSVLLRFLEGFDNSNLNKDSVNTKRSILICATNRKQDLDAALLSRFDLQLHFGLPDVAARKAIFGRYAKQLSDTELQQLAELSDGMSGRDIRDSCEIAERAWVSNCIRNKKSVTVPPMQQYIDAVKRRVNETKRTSPPATGNAFGLNF